MGIQGVIIKPHNSNPQGEFVEIVCVHACVCACCVRRWGTVLYSCYIGAALESAVNPKKIADMPKKYLKF